MNNLVIEQLNIKDKHIIDNLMQIYLHDISYYFKCGFNSLKGIYVYDNYNEYFNNNNKFIYLIKNNNDIVGFSLVDKEENEMILQEFFILVNYRNNKLGENAAVKIFDMYKTNWTIKALPNSKIAENFWLKTIKNYTNNNFDLQHVGKYNRAEFRFSNK